MNRERSTLSPERRHLTPESIMRIQITLSSRKTSVVVFNTHARLVAVGEGKWDAVATGAPCIILAKETSAPDSPFQVRLAIAEIESGISIWDEEVDETVDYAELQPTFHTFTVAGQSLALQFADASEATSLIDCLKQYIAQKIATDQMLEEKLKRKKGKGSKKTKKSALDSAKRISKLDISSPCEFRHLSGITAGNSTTEYQQELEGSVMRRQRSASMSAVASKNSRRRGKETMDNGEFRQRADTLSDSPAHIKKPLFKSHSVRVVKKRRPIIDQIKTSSDDSSIRSTPSRHSVSANSQEHSYWSIDDFPPSKNSSTNKLSPSPNHEPSVTCKNSAPSQIQQAWRNSLSNEDVGSKSSRNSTPHTSEAASPVPGGQVTTSAPALDKKNGVNYTAWLESLTPLNPTNVPPQHAQLNTSPKHFPSANVLSSPAHVTAAANAKKYMHVKPNFNTYDTLLPLNPNVKLPPLGPPVATKPTSNTQQKENSSKPLTTAVPSVMAKPVSTKPPPLSIKENGVVTPPSVSSPGDLDSLTAELSKVLQDFDSLIAPHSPVDPSFQYAPTQAKETMV